MRRWWPTAILAGLGLTLAVVVASASTSAPQADSFHRTPLSASGTFAAYPDIAVGSGGLVVAVWTEGDGGTTEKHVGPLKLGWISDSTSGWQSKTVDSGDVYDVAVAVSGSTAHVVWSWEKNVVLYTSCGSPDYDCPSRETVATAGEEALQVDVVLDGSGTPHVVWVEGDNKVYYSRKGTGGWTTKQAVQGSTDSEGPAIAYANGYVHAVWTEWLFADHSDSQARYCRQAVAGNSWANCITLADWDFDNLLARNLSIAAEDGGNVYVVWDMVSADDAGTKSKYAIGYKHSTDNGVTWRATRSYPTGSEFGSEFAGAAIFESGEGTLWDEYIRFLRPHVSLAVSDTLTVPVLAWHARVTTGSGGEELLQIAAGTAYKIYWDHATQPGSDTDGYIAWASSPITLSADLCGELDMNVDSAAASLAIVGDLIDAKNGGTPSGDHLHVVYHEEAGSDSWSVLYNSNEQVACLRVYLPLVSKNASGGGGGGQ